MVVVVDVLLVGNGGRITVVEVATTVVLVTAVVEDCPVDVDVAGVEVDGFGTVVVDTGGQLTVPWALASRDETIRPTAANVSASTTDSTARRWDATRTRTTPATIAATATIAITPLLAPVSGSEPLHTTLPAHVNS